MRKFDKKGFTMVELLAAITIVAILTVIVLFSVKTVLDKSTKEYYKGEEKMIVLSAQTYFSDYKSKLPKEIGTIERVTLKTLIDEKYIDPVYDHKKKACDYDNSFAYAQKADDENYQYYVFLKCESNQTETDDRNPVVKFDPNKGLANKNINVKMKITDNQSVSAYRYIIMKNNEQIKDSGVLTYDSDPTITLTEDGIYQIIGYGFDTSGNMGSKTSGIYEIKKTGPNCSNVIFEENKSPNIWMTGKVNITIKVTEDTYRWTWATRNALNITSSTTYGKAKQYLGTTMQTMTFTKDGQNQGKVTLYDKVGNHCTVETGKYWLWNSPPTFNDFTIKSTEKTYNAITTKLTITASNAPGLPMQMYISNTGFETGGSWETYASTKNWNVGGRLDGGTRTVYITIKDSLGNKKQIKKTYKVYQDCVNMNITRSYGQCRKKCGGGTQDETAVYNDKITGNYCKTEVNSNYPCNTMDCCSGELKEVLGSWSGCDKECGGGHKYQSASYYSKYDGSFCRTDSKAYSQTCNTQSCSLAISTESVTGGTIDVKSSATPGTTVEFTPRPLRTEPGYATDSRKDFTYAGARIKDQNGNVIQTLSASETSFKMPNHAVTIRPKWKKDDLVLVNLDGPISMETSSFGWGNSTGGWGMSVTADHNRNFARWQSNEANGQKQSASNKTAVLAYFHTIEFTFNEWGGDKPNVHATCIGAANNNFYGAWDANWAHNAPRRVSASSGANYASVTMRLDVRDVTDTNDFYTFFFEVQAHDQHTVVDLTRLVLRGNLYE